MMLPGIHETPDVVQPGGRFQQQLRARREVERTLQLLKKFA